MRARRIASVTVAALAVIEVKDARGVKQTAGIHLIWSSPKPCSGVGSDAEMLDGIQIQGLAAFTSQLKSVLKNDIPRTVDGQIPAQSE